MYRKNSPIKIIDNKGGDKMTKQDYIKIANVLKECFVLGISDTNKDFYEKRILSTFSCMLAIDNNKFNLDKFTNYIKGIK